MWFKTSDAEVSYLTMEVLFYLSSSSEMNHEPNLKGNDNPIFKIEPYEVRLIELIREYWTSVLRAVMASAFVDNGVISREGSVEKGKESCVC